MTSENWKPIAGYEGSYEVSDLGRVRSLARKVLRAGVCKSIQLGERVLHACVDSGGYKLVTLYKEGVQTPVRVHCLTALCFLGARPTPKHEVNHINGVKTDNRLVNIEWVTRSRNVRHAFEIGLIPHQNKYRVSCPELGLATVGVSAMVLACRELGYLRVTSDGIYKGIERGSRHRNLVFSKEALK